MSVHAITTYKPENRYAVNKFRESSMMKLRVDVKLKEMEEQIQNAEKTCNYIKDRLDYMKSEYAKSKSIDFKRFLDLSSTKSPNSFSSAIYGFNSSSINGSETNHSPLNLDKILRDNKIDYLSNITTPITLTSSPKSIENAPKKNLSNSESESKKMTKSVNEDTKCLPVEPIDSYRKSSSSSSNSSNQNADRSVSDIFEPQGIFKPLTITVKGYKKPQLILKMNRGQKFSNHKTKNVNGVIKRMSSKKIAALKNKKQRFTKKRNVDIRKKIEPLRNKQAKDVIEIYHNTAVKNISSVTSSKQYFELNNQKNIDYVTKDETTIDLDQSNIKKNTNKINLTYASSKEEQLLCRDLNDNNSGCAGGVKDTIPRDTGRFNDTQIDNHQPRHRRQKDVRPFTGHYQFPTMASELKKANRCCFTTKLNLKNFPFVVGTSITSSHNIGLNFQEALNLMKMKQNRVNVENPRPKSMNAKNVNDSIVTILQNFNNQPGFVTKKPTFSTKQMLAVISDKRVDVGKEEMRNIDFFDMKESEIGLNECLRLEKLQTEHIDKSECIDVIQRLHDRFNALNKRYEDLQKQVEKKSDDETLKNELRDVEKELNEKEQEIRTIANLHSEVKALKRQIKMPQTNSLVYIATNYITKENLPVAKKSRIYQSSRPFDYRKPSVMMNDTNTTNSITLMRLLRHIQTLISQLKTL